MADVSVVSFDLDDTLWELGPVIERAEQRLRAWLLTHYAQVAEHFSPQQMFALRPRMLAEHPAHRHDVSYLRRATLRHCFAQVGEPLAAADEAYEVFYAARNEVELFADARPTLERLAARFRLVALTNGNADVQRIGLGTYFDVVITASAVGASKPDRLIFERAAQAAGVAPDDVVHVGDHPLADVEGALGAGMGAVWLNRSGAPWPEELSPVLRAEGDAHHEIRTLAELETLLAVA